MQKKIDRIEFDRIQIEDESGVAEPEYVECAICGNKAEADEIINKVCNHCIEENSSLENAIDWGKDDKTQLKINPLWLSVFGENQINKILQVEFEKKPDWLQQEFIDSYINSDKGGFAEYLIKKEEE